MHAASQHTTSTHIFVGRAHQCKHSTNCGASHGLPVLHLHQDHPRNQYTHIDTCHCTIYLCPQLLIREQNSPPLHRPPSSFNPPVLLAGPWCPCTSCRHSSAFRCHELAQGYGNIWLDWDGNTRGWQVKFSKPDFYCIFYAWRLALFCAPLLLPMLGAAKVFIGLWLWLILDLIPREVRKNSRGLGAHYRTSQGSWIVGLVPNKTLWGKVFSKH